MQVRLFGESHYVATLPDGEEVYLDRVSHILAEVGIGPKFGGGAAKAAAALGTEFHEMARAHLTSGWTPVWEDFHEMSDDRRALLNCWTLFTEWLAGQDFEVLDTERKVASLRLAFAGTLDVRVRCRRTGRVIIIDFKTSKPLTSKPSKVAYKLQLAAYGLALSEMGEELPAEAYVLRVGKECAAPEITFAWQDWDQASEALYAWEQTVMLASYIRRQREAA